MAGLGGPRCFDKKRNNDNNIDLSTKRNKIKIEGKSLQQFHACPILATLHFNYPPQGMAFRNFIYP